MNKASEKSTTLASHVSRMANNQPVKSLLLGESTDGTCRAQRPQSKIQKHAKKRSINVLMHLANANQRKEKKLRVFTCQASDEIK